LGLPLPKHDSTIAPHPLLPPEMCHSPDQATHFHTFRLCVRRLPIGLEVTASSPGETKENHKTPVKIGSISAQIQIRHIPCTSLKCDNYTILLGETYCVVVKRLAFLSRIRKVLSSNIGLGTGDGTYNMPTSIRTLYSNQYSISYRIEKSK
jgi:hypothetical protein